MMKFEVGPNGSGGAALSPVALKQLIASNDASFDDQYQENLPAQSFMEKFQTFRSMLSNLKPHDRWTLLYLAGTLPVCFIANSPAEVVWVGVALRLLIIPLVIYARTMLQQTSPLLFTIKLDHSGKGGFEFDLGRLYWILDGYVGFIFLYLYSEEGALIHNIWGGFSFDPEVQVIEEWMFGGQPSQDARVWLYSRVLGEYLHICYFAFYFVIAATGAALYFFCPREHFDRGISALCLSFYTCFAIYLFIPVKGPFHEFQRPNPDDVGFFMSNVVHYILVKESSQGTATPSSHCAIAIACWVIMSAYHRPMAIVFISLVPGLVYATVWCGFHYAFDAVIGVVVGVCAASAGILLAKAVHYNEPYRDRHNYMNVLDKAVYDEEIGSVVIPTIAEPMVWNQQGKNVRYKR